MRYLPILVLALAALGCGGSSSDTSSTGGGACDPLAFAMLNTANSNAKVCPATVACMDSKCAEAVKECAGPDYKTGTYTGTCGAYLGCVKACACVKSCVDACDPGTLDCASCLSIDLAMGCTLKCTTEIASCGKR